MASSSSVYEAVKQGIKEPQNNMEQENNSSKTKKYSTGSYTKENPNIQIHPMVNMSYRVCSATDTKTDKDKDINRKQERLNPARCLGVVMMLFLRD
ncbi:hypothetical protein ACROYT_G033904 [Oculina patagonica]